MGRRVKDQLSELEVRPSKQRGQNFVINPGVISDIVSFGSPQPGEKLIEIGPGLGALTLELQRHSDLTLIEIEPSFCAELQKKFPQVKIHCIDARQFDFSSLGNDLVVFGNLPYSYSTEILFHLIDNAQHIRRAVLLLQKEFVDRMAAGPGGRDYGVLSISCQLWAEIKLGPVVSGDNFHPPTKVQSRVVELIFRKDPLIPVAEIDWFKRVVKAAFFRRRKKIHNSLAASGQFSAEKIDVVLTAAGIDKNRRAETLSIEEFLRLARALGGE